MPPCAPPPGIYVPTLCFFKPGPRQELDLPAFAAHLLRLANAGVAGIVLHHAIGEPTHLSRTERAQLLSHAHTALADHAAHDLPLIVGTGAQSTWETIDLCEEAGALGGQFCLVECPLLGPGEAPMGDAELEGFYFDVADHSPLPLVLSPRPPAEFSLPLLQRLAQHPNIVGLLTSSPSLCSTLSAQFPAKAFTPLCTRADELLPALVSGAQGGVLPLGNVCPEKLLRVWDGWKMHELEEARRAQRPLARAGVIEGAGVRGVRTALQVVHGYGGRCRLPLLELAEREREAVARACDALEQKEKGKGKPLTNGFGPH
ncbi:aldolase [Calocera cornea HHB12733]|uniref:Aldolase n=1 Tax=Calocera cornea HHB12733 TaxID=1353952 RepID=A0A165F2C0_9BASI|nr:aldolase [Calocera cornea HHB12733]